MSIMFFKVRSVSRGQGHSAVAKAAYISREKLRDERTGLLHDYRRTEGLRHSELILPERLSGRPPDWAVDRATLWNHAEAREPRKNSRVGREYTIALPHELPEDGRIALARGFARRIAERHGVAVDLAVHGPTRRGDPRNHHMHVLATTREAGAEQLLAKTSIEWANDVRKARNLPYIAVEYRELRQAWATLANESLREAGLSQRLEPRSRATIAREHAAELGDAQASAGRGRGDPSAGMPLDLAVTRTPRLPDAYEPPLAITPEATRAIERWIKVRERLAGMARPMRGERAKERDHDTGLEF
jgi:hypothetical protein